MFKTVLMNIKGAYEYGMGLLMAALVLRRSASLSPDKNRQLAALLGSTWNRLLAAVREQMTRLRVAGLFYRDISQVVISTFPFFFIINRFFNPSSEAHLCALGKSFCYVLLFFLHRKTIYYVGVSQYIFYYYIFESFYVSMFLCMYVYYLWIAKPLDRLR